MGSGRPRSVVCAVVALALIAALPHAAEAKPKHKHPFGSRVLQPGTKGKDVRYLQRALTRLGVVDRGRRRLRQGDDEERRGSGVPARLAGQRRRQPQGREADRKLVVKRRVSGSYFVQGLVSPDAPVTSRHAGQREGEGARLRRQPSSRLMPVSFAGAESRTSPGTG